MAQPLRAWPEYLAKIIRRAHRAGGEQRVCVGMLIMNRAGGAGAFIFICQPPKDAMRLSAEVLSLAEQWPNALGEREIILRGLGIPAIEHLAVTRDAFDTMDFSDNRLTRVENFPRLNRLSSLLLGGNVVTGIDARNLATNVPNLTTLVLTDNQIAGLHEVAKIAAGCPKLEFLSLRGNPVVRKFRVRLHGDSLLYCLPLRIYVFPFHGILTPKINSSSDMM